MKKLLIVLSTLLFCSCGSTKSTQEPDETQIDPEKTHLVELKGFCKRISSERTANAAIMFARGCWGPKDTQASSYYLATYFEKKDALKAAREIATELGKWVIKVGSDWDLGKVMVEECTKRRGKMMCTYVYQLVNRGN